MPQKAFLDLASISLSSLTHHLILPGLVLSILLTELTRVSWVHHNLTIAYFCLWCFLCLTVLSQVIYLPTTLRGWGRGVLEGTQYRISLFPISVLNKLKNKVKRWRSWEIKIVNRLPLELRLEVAAFRCMNPVRMLIKNTRVGQLTSPLQQHWVGLSLAWWRRESLPQMHCYMCALQAVDPSRKKREIELGKPRDLL